MQTNESSTTSTTSTTSTEATARPLCGERPTPTLLTRHEGGFAAQGRGFYVWDRDPAEVIRVAEALQAGRMTGSRSARFLVIDPADAVGA